ncbi:MAG TPA: S9 family peptidase [Longimicrobiaceae bacterium]|nr:S9 family peptidase [Longimicrobiaceae bacterium]
MQIGARRALAAAILALPLAGTAAAQGDRLTVERIFASPDFRAGAFYPTWTPGGESFTLVEGAQGGGSEVWTQGVVTGNRERLIPGSALMPQGAARGVDVEDITWSADRKHALLFTNSQPVWRRRTKGTYYVYDAVQHRTTPVSAAPGWQQFAKLSPDGARVGFVRDNDLSVVELATGRETRLTRDGGPTVINGTFDWVHEEELDLRDGWRWSPDSRRIAFWRLDTSPEKTQVWTNDLSGVHSQAVELRYPKPGDANAIAKIGVVAATGGPVTWMDTGAERDIYLARMDWAASPTELVIQRMNRLQNHIDVLFADAATGRSRTVFTDADSAWLNVDDDLTFVGGGAQMLWTSQRDGYNQVYLYDRQGRMVRQLTRERWDVTGIDGVDESDGWVFFTGTGGDPTQRHAFRVKLDGTGMQKLTTEPGTHSVSWSPDGRHFVDVYSRLGTPPVSRLYRADGTLVRALSDNAAVMGKLAATGIQAPEFIKVPGAGGSALNAWIIRPAGFDATKKYPVLLYEYGTPGSQTVTDSWGGTRYLWHQLLAQNGYIVMSVDTHGTSARGSDFEKAGYLRQGEVVTDELMGVARWLGQQPWADAGRIGMWGWSGGGYTTALSLARGGTLFKAGISVAPVTDWRLYDNIYTERFMRTPQQNAQGYDRSSPLKLASGLTANYLLVHGTGDDNVHFQNSVQWAAALQAAGKPFSFMMYPGKNHGLPGTATQLHLFNMMTNFVKANL